MKNGKIEESDKEQIGKIFFYHGNDNFEPCFVYVRHISKWSMDDETLYLCEKINTSISCFVKKQDLIKDISFSQYEEFKRKWEIENFKRAIIRLEEKEV